LASSYRRNSQDIDPGFGRRKRVSICRKYQVMCRTQTKTISGGQKPFVGSGAGEFPHLAILISGWGLERRLLLSLDKRFPNLDTAPRAITLKASSYRDLSLKIENISTWQPAQD
jgi:hypothetical protein